MIRRLFLFLFSFPIFLFGQKDDSVPLLRSFQLSYENDLFTNTDYYYTGGTFLEFNFPFLKKNPVSKILCRLKNGNDERFGISLNNLGFTPTSIKSDSILFNDRPFAATFYLGLNRVSCNAVKQIRMTSEIDLGLIGPLAFGYETQKFIHEHTNNPIPHGWQFQIGNDVFLNYGMKLEKGLISRKKGIDIIGYGFANAGTVYDNAGFGLTTRIGRMDNYFTAPGFSKRFQFWLSGSAEYKLAIYDATLEGGLFNSQSVYVISPEKLKRNIFSYSAGIVLAYEKIRIEYFDSFSTPEFENARKHGFGHAGIAVIF